MHRPHLTVIRWPRGEAAKALGFHSTGASAVGGLAAAFAMALVSPQLATVVFEGSGLPNICGIVPGTLVCPVWTAIIL